MAKSLDKVSLPARTGVCFVGQWLLLAERVVPGYSSLQSQRLQLGGANGFFNGPRLFFNFLFHSLHTYIYRRQMIDSEAA